MTLWLVLACTGPKGLKVPDPVPSPVSREVVRIGEVRLTTINAGPGPTFISLHDDENTAVEAALPLVLSRGGRLVLLEQVGRRTVQFGGGEADPNRIFTDEGLAASQRKWSSGGTAAFIELREAIIARLRPPIVALHNNTDGHWSVSSYVEGLASEASDVYVHEGGDPDDFLFVTEPALFAWARDHELSVVLQAPAAADDGSLSIYCANRNLPYVNVEAEHGHLAVQRAMLTALLDRWDAPLSPDEERDR